MGPLRVSLSLLGPPRLPLVIVVIVVIIDDIIDLFVLKVPDGEIFFLGHVQRSGQIRIGKKLLGYSYIFWLSSQSFSTLNENSLTASFPFRSEDLTSIDTVKTWSFDVRFVKVTS